MTKSERMEYRRRMFNLNPYCHWCDKRMILHPEPEEVEEMATIEHLLSVANGGLHETENLRLVHKKCNK